MIFNKEANKYKKELADAHRRLDETTSRLINSIIACDKQNLLIHELTIKNNELAEANKALSDEPKKAVPRAPDYCGCVDATIDDLKKKIEEQESIIRERENTVNQRDAEICALKWQIDCDRETKAALRKEIDILHVKVGALEAERDAKKPPLSNLGEAEKKYDLAREAPKFFAALFEVSNGGRADGE